MFVPSYAGDHLWLIFTLWVNSFSIADLIRYIAYRSSTFRTWWSLGLLNLEPSLFVRGTPKSSMSLSAVIECYLACQSR